MKGLVPFIIQKYTGLHDEILFKRGARFLGSSLRSYADFDTYVTHAAFHKLKGLPLPAVLGRNGAPPWFADLQEARKIARRNRPASAPDFWASLLARMPAEFFTNPEFVVAKRAIGNKRLGTGNISFRIMELSSVASLLNRQHVDMANGNSARPGKSEQMVLACWARLLTDKSANPPKPESLIDALVQAYSACPGHPKFHENILMTGGILDQTPIWLAEFRKGADETVYRIALAGMQDRENVAGRNQNRLIRHAFRQFELFMMELNRKRKDLCVDFIGSTENGTAMTGHSIFRILVAKKIADLKALEPSAYDALYQEVTRYRYPPFNRAEIVTRADIFREVLQRMKGKLLGFARKNS